ncbi:VOC family protein [Filimonas effusa]|uniref:VOC family protein n=1 Tax=Filimonas effusa TaxID=2508721 RepID=A0A4Q1D3F4_9BACT|nr:VOC family protein [Filimonas effusa]RXK82919.1 VOC family protein [Filimonas effusa]
MILRVARHTMSLQPIITFYTNLLGLEIIGDFKNHQNYDGVFLGLKDAGWHLEFTVSNEPPVHTVDEDDLLVFYADNYEAYLDLLKRAAELQIPGVKPKNPYWLANGTTLLDPDGYRIVITYKKHG